MTTRVALLFSVLLHVGVFSLLWQVIKQPEQADVLQQKTVEVKLLYTPPELQNPGVETVKEEQAASRITRVVPDRASLPAGSQSPVSVSVIAALEKNHSRKPLLQEKEKKKEKKNRTPVIQSSIKKKTKHKQSIRSNNKPAPKRYKRQDKPRPKIQHKSQSPVIPKHIQKPSRSLPTAKPAPGQSAKRVLNTQISQLSAPAKNTQPLPVPQAASKAGNRAGSPDPAMQQAYQSAVQRALNANKHYPKRARKMRHQGVATVSFVILHDGTVQQITITQSSGYSSLDQATLRAVRKINRQFPIPAKLHRKRWHFVVSLRYELR